MGGGGLFYNGQDVIYLLGSKITAGVASSAQTDPSWVITGSTLTATYAGNVSAALNVKVQSHVNFNVWYTAGTNATELDLKFEMSGDFARFNAPVNWYQETAEVVGAGVTTEYLQTRKFNNNGNPLVASTIYKFQIGAAVADCFIRISAQEVLSSGSAFGSIYVEAVVSGT